ncbi:cingulin isoform X1 [Falco rusticolus]|uniref:cingulin isoform X1 n=2 Tax=Falco rusticolus TaxID=120794 RepID=UPI0018865A1C|nr:cingulin isoform X1 [Falco rusticolus]
MSLLISVPPHGTRAAAPAALGVMLRGARAPAAARLRRSAGAWQAAGAAPGCGARLGSLRSPDLWDRRLPSAYPGSGCQGPAAQRADRVLSPGMEWPASAAMEEKQSPVDYGVQIRFINDLQEPRRPPKTRSKPGSYGVAVRVQGIAGQPFVVLNSGEKGGDSFGVQIKSQGSYPNPPAGPWLSGSLSSDSDLPENPYAGRPPQRGSSCSTSDEEASSASTAPKAPPGKRLLREELRRSQSHGDLLSATMDQPFATGAPWAGGSRQPRALAGSRSSSMMNIAPERSKAAGSRAMGKDASSDTEAAAAAGGSDVDTKPLSSVDSLISKFDGKVQPRGRAARRGRIPSEERKRSQSLDGRISHRNVPDAGELSGAQRQAGSLRPQPPVPTSSLGRLSRAGGMEDRGARSPRPSRGVEEPMAERLQSKARAELQLKSTPDLLRDQREVTQPGSSEHPKEVIYSILKEGSSESEISLKRKTARLLERMQELAAPTKDAACSQPQHRELAKKVEELQEKLDEETKLRQKLELPREPARSSSARALEARLREAEGESQRLREALDKKTQELQRSLQELSELKSAKEQAETRLGDCGEQLLVLHQELNHLRQGSGTSPDGDALYKELLETREELEEALSSKQRQEEQLRLRERELTALKGALKEEVASHDKELDRVRQQYQSDMDQLRRSMEDISQDQASLESERQKINAVVRNLQRELEESTEETGHWRDMFQKNKDELRNTKQELLQVKLEREEFEEELRELRERFAAAREEADQARSSAVDPSELEALRKELRQARETQRELVAEKQSQEEQLRQRERELAALRGTMQEEASSRDGELERYRRDLQQLQQERDEATKAKASLESTREASEQARKTVESSLREVQEQNDDLRRKILGMEMQLKEYERLGENWEGSQARLKEKVTKLEAERRQMEESLGEAMEREQELLMAKRSLETRLEEAQRSLARLTQEHQELSVSYQDEQRQKEQLKRAKSELEEQKRLLDRTTEKLNKELEQMTEESHSSLTMLKSQLEEFKEKSRKEITDSQKQAKDRGAEVEKMQFSMGRLQDEVARLKQALQDSQAERESVLLDKEVLLQRLHNLEQEMETKKRSQDDRSRHVKALEEKSKRLEVELDEERTTVELLTERVNRSRDQIDQLRAELLQERSSRQDLECDKASLERQNKELKNRLASSEGLQKPSSNVSQLEARVEELQDKLQAEEREKSVLLSSNRKLERKVKELTIQIDDERQHVSNQKDQLSLRVKALKRQVDEAEEEIERLEGARKKAQRELEEQHELNEQLQNRIKALEKEAWRKATRSATDSSLQDDQLSSDEEFDSAYGPSSIASLLNEASLQTSSC